jgi:hypothetical protein
MRPAHVNTFASNIANFVSKNNLDGVDVDWEVRTTACLYLDPVLESDMVLLVSWST